MARKPRRQIVNFTGSPAIKIGAPSPRTDIYYWVMEMSWPAFIALASAIFIAINLAFGLIYAALPGTVANAEPGSIIDGFFFSVDTPGTVGYGVMAGALSILTYGMALTAFSLGPTAPLAALRETGMVTALIISILFLKERATAGRIAGVFGILAGAALILAG